MRFILFFLALVGFYAQALESTSSWSNNTSNSSSSDYPKFDSYDCPEVQNKGCGIIVFGAPIFDFVSTLYTHVVATEILTIQESLGEVHTLTRLEQSNSSFTFPRIENDKFDWVFAVPVTDTVLTSYGTQLYWGTIYNVFPYSAALVFENIETLNSYGNTICGQSRYWATPTAKSTNEADDYFITAAPPFLEGFLPDNPFFQKIGFDPQANCSIGVVGPPPTYNVPVLSLTVTSTVLQSDIAPAEPGSAAPTRQVVQATTKPSSFPAQTNTPTEQVIPSASQSDQTDFLSLVQNSVEPGSSATPTSSAVITIAGSPIVSDAQGGYKVGTYSLSQGGLPFTVSGTVVSLAPSATALIVDSSTIPLQKNPPTPEGHVITIAGRPLAEDAQGNYLVDGQTLKPGGPSVQISGTPFSLFPFATAIAVGSSTMPLPNNAVPSGQPEITIAEVSITADAQGAYVFGTQTLIPDGTPIRISGTPYSLFPSATALLVGSSTVSLQHSPATHNIPSITISGQAITSNPQGEYIIAGQTLTPAGPPITISGTLYSLSPSGTALQIDSSIIPLSLSTPAMGPILTVAGQTLTPDSSGAYVIGFQTIKPGGPPVTVSGTGVSLGADGHTAVVGGATEVLASTTAGQGIGGLVWSGIGGGGASSGGNGSVSTDGRIGAASGTETGAVQFTGGASLNSLDVLRNSICIAIGLAMFVGFE